MFDQESGEAEKNEEIIRGALVQRVESNESNESKRDHCHHLSHEQSNLVKPGGFDKFPMSWKKEIERDRKSQIIDVY